jgi:hypothetical protein
MGWKEIRAKSKDIVHATFALPAIYSASGIAGPYVACSARLHNKLEVFGDLDREGFAKRFEEVNQIVLDTTQVTPVKNAVIDFGIDALGAPISGSNEKYRITNNPPRSLERYMRCEVIKLDEPTP